MNKTPLEMFFNSLLPNLWEEFIFFIPNRSIPKSIKNNFKNQDIEKYFNRIMVFDTYKGPMLYEEGSNNNKIILKSSKLENNLFRLLDKQNLTNPSEFNFILEKYLEQIECLKYISQWMYENLEQVHDINETKKGLFFIQQNHFEKHVKAFKSQFYKNNIDENKNVLNVEEIIKSTLEQINKQEQEQNQIQSPTSDVATDLATDKDSQKTPQKATKQPLISEQDAEKMILKQVFNLDTSIII